MESPVILYLPAKDEIEIDRKEVYRYMGYTMKQINETEEHIAKMIEDVIRQTEEIITPKACYSRFPVEVKKDGRILLPYGEVVSHDLTRNLHDCQEIFLFAATIGADFDRLLRRTRVESMAKAAILQAAGAAAVESLCDHLNDELKRQIEAEGNITHPRYSPGYGDYVLENQKGIFSVLQPPRYIGLSLMDTLIMAPEKSVTAVIGIEY
ncbi:MAG: Vitamin B12 dependent methionine synthase activation subunit [Lachnospiraceae bacterium]|nr:Vitamin B12 dependent methionine synthase activation subunit [Lachnospiraceae bacterium]